MAEEKKSGGWIKGLFTTVIGLCSGASLMYLSPLIDKVIKPSKPLANFAVQAQGLSVTLENRSTGGVEGWWDFGDGSALEPFSPDKAQVPHNYEKPGVYTVKLSLRNLIGDENDRTVSVNIGAQAAANAAATGPVIEALEVTRLRPDNFAPAMFKLTAKVKNADMCMWFLGDERMDVASNTAAPERIAMFRKPGEHKIKLVAISGKQTVEKTQIVQLQAASATAIMAVLQVSHEAVHVHKLQKTHTVAQGFPPNEKGNVHRFVREIPAEPGFQIKQFAFVTPPDTKVVNKPSLQAADGKKVILTGELTRSTGVLHRTAPTPNWVTQITLTQERREPAILRKEEPMAYPLSVPGTTMIPLRKLSEDWETKNDKFSLEMHEGTQVIWQNPDLPKTGTNNTLTIRNKTYRVMTAVQENAQVRVEVIEIPRPGGISRLEN